MATCAWITVGTSEVAHAEDWSMDEPGPELRPADDPPPRAPPVSDQWSGFTFGFPIEAGIAVNQPRFGFGAFHWHLTMGFGPPRTVRGLFDFLVGLGAAWSELETERSGATRWRITGQMRSELTIGGCAAAKICFRAGGALRLNMRRYPLTMEFDPVFSLSFLARKRRVDVNVAYSEFPVVRLRDPTSRGGWDGSARFWVISLRIGTLERREF